MANTVTLTADIRTDSGKGAARTLRRAGKVPAVIYGRGRDSEALTLDRGDLTKLVSQISSSTPVDVTVAGRDPVQATCRITPRGRLAGRGAKRADRSQVTAGQGIEQGGLARSARPNESDDERGIFQCGPPENGSVEGRDRSRQLRFEVRMAEPSGLHRKEQVT